MKKVERGVKLLLMTLFMLMSATVISATIVSAETIPVLIDLQFGQTEGRTILDMINEMRTSSEDCWYWNSDDTTKTWQTSLEPLQYDKNLEQVAMLRAMECALAYSHTRPNGSRCFSAYSELGVYYMSAGENIAAGYGTAEYVNQGWREDDDPYSGQGHRRNMLNPNFNAVGIGHVVYRGRHYWVEEFGNLSSITTPGTPDDSAQRVSIDVSTDIISNFSVAFTPAVLRVKPGEEGYPPAMVKKLTVVNDLGTYIDVIQNDVSLSIEDTTLAVMSGNMIRGLTEGETNLIASFAGFTSETKCPLKITYEEDYSLGGTVTNWKNLESAHPYSNEDDLIWCYIAPGSDVVSLSVTFDSQTYTERNFDIITILDMNDEVIGVFSGEDLASQTITVPGNTVKIHLQADYSVSEWGFKVSDLVINRSGPSIQISQNGHSITASINGDVDIVKHGILYLTSASTQTVTLNTPGRSDISYTDFTSDKKYTFDSTGLSHVSLCGYFTYRDTNGTEKTVYSDILYIQ